MEATFKHPNYPDARPYTKIIEQRSDLIITRIEYPDGVIVIFNLTVEDIAISSNRNCVLSEENGTTLITPKLDSVNDGFVDVI